MKGERPVRDAGIPARPQAAPLAGRRTARTRGGPLAERGVRPVSLAPALETARTALRSDPGLPWRA